MRKQLVILSIGMLLSLSGKAQFSLEEFSLDGDVMYWYDSILGVENTLLLNGELYAFTRKSPNSHAFYEGQAWQAVDILYFGQSFERVPALYNLEDDQIIIKNPLDITSPLMLVKSEVAGFDFGEKHFVRIDEEVGFRSGDFYLMAYEGEQVSLLFKLYKKLTIKNGVFTYEMSYDPFVKFQNDYKLVTRFSGIKGMFPQLKKELKRLKKNIGMSSRLDRENQVANLSQLIKYCDQKLKK